MSVMNFVGIGLLVVIILMVLGVALHRFKILSVSLAGMSFVLLLGVMGIAMLGTNGSYVKYQVAGTYQDGQLAVQQKEMSSDTWFNLQPEFMNNVDDVNTSIQNDFKRSGIMIKLEDGDKVTGAESFSLVGNPLVSSINSGFTVQSVQRLNAVTNTYDPVSLVAKVSDVDFTYHKSDLTQVNSFKNVNMDLSDDKIKSAIIDQAKSLDLQESDKVQGILTYANGNYDFTITHLSRIEPSGDYQVIK